MFQSKFRTSSRSSGYRRFAECKQVGIKARIGMMEDSASGPSGKRNALLAIAAGGGIAGALDLTQACILFGWRVPLTIAAGLLGPEARHGGAGTYVLGVVLHFIYRLLGGGYLLPGKPQVAFPDGASTHMRFVLWRRGRKSHDPCRLAALRSSRPRPVRTSRPASRAAGAHGGGRTADFLQRRALR